MSLDSISTFRGHFKARSGHVFVVQYATNGYVTWKVLPRYLAKIQNREIIKCSRCNKNAANILDIFWPAYTDYNRCPSCTKAEQVQSSMLKQEENDLD